MKFPLATWVWIMGCSLLVAQTPTSKPTSRFMRYRTVTSRAPKNGPG